MKSYHSVAFILCWFLFASVYAHNHDFNCFTIIAGSKVTVDGSVMMAHNEDDGGEQMLNWYRVPEIKHGTADFYSFKNGGREPMPFRTNGYLWLELPKMEVSDGYLNDCGVAIVSDGCPSREDREDYTDGGVVYELRQIVAQQASSARHAVEIIGRLVEKYGYASSGRTYCIADSKEAWTVAVVQGRHWVAQRVPDDHVMILPNNYTIDHVNLEDKENFAGSIDIVSYAIERGWYDPVKDGRFSFRKVYSAKGNIDNMGNINRIWVALCRLTGNEFSKNGDYPYAIVPKEKISLNILMEELASHYTDKPWEIQKKNPSHLKKGSVCNNTTQYGVVFQLRDHMPVEIGALMWLAPYHPCMQTFVPYYLGMNQMPAQYARYDDYSKALANHFVDTDNFRENYPDKAYWRYVDLSDKVKKNYARKIKKVKLKKESAQKELFMNQQSFEKKMIDLYDHDKVQCSKELYEYTAKWLEITR